MVKTKEKKEKKDSRKQKTTLVVTKDEFKKLRPVISPYVHQKKKTDKDLLLKVDVREIKKRSIIKRIFPTPDSRKILLDRLGMDVFLLCDGKHKVKDIINNFQEKYRLTPIETETAVQNYLMSLTERHLVGFLVPNELAKKNQLIEGTIEKIIIESK